MYLWLKVKYQKRFMATWIHAIYICCCCSITKLHPMLRPHRLQHARLLYPPWLCLVFILCVDLICCSSFMQQLWESKCINTPEWWGRMSICAHPGFGCWECSGQAGQELSPCGAETDCASEVKDSNAQGERWLMRMKTKWWESRAWAAFSRSGPSLGQARLFQTLIQEWGGVSHARIWGRWS